jgi:phage tail sheath protein FI
MIEETLKRLCLNFVFEPNDTKTWTAVKSMIENYLTEKWKEGALAGARSSDAFFVKLGLGVTMTASDILEGRMNITIGMAPGRPDEFILLTLTQKVLEK